RSVIAGRLRRAQQPPRDRHVRELHHRKEEHRRHDRRREEASAGLTDEIPCLIHGANGPASRGWGDEAGLKPGLICISGESGIAVAAVAAPTEGPRASLRAWGPLPPGHRPEAGGSAAA